MSKERPINGEITANYTRPDIVFTHKDIATIDRGGLCVLFKSLASGLASQGFRVHVLTTQELVIDNISVHRLPAVDDALSYSKYVSEAISDIGPLIAESSTWRFELLEYSRLVNKGSKVVVRADPSASTLFDNATNLDQGEGELCRNADLILAVSGFAKRDIQKKYHIPDGKIRVVYNGVQQLHEMNFGSRITSGEILTPSTNESNPIISLPISDIINPDKINVLWIGKPTKMKGFDMLEAIVANAPDELNFIINMGYSIQEVKWADQNYRKCTFIRGLTKSDQQLLFHNSDALLSTSTVEGFGIVVAEALEMGIPTILNINCEVFREFLGINGIKLVDVMDVNVVYDAFKNIKPQKSPNSLLPYHLTQQEMVRQSLEHYRRMLDIKA